MLSVVDKISFKQRQILIHSYIYYNLNKNLISDQTYDRISYSLVDLMKQHPDEFKNSEYADLFESYDGNSGFGLYEALNDNQKEMIEVIAHYLCRYNNSKKNSKF